MADAMTGRSDTLRSAALHSLDALLDVIPHFISTDCKFAMQASTAPGQWSGRPLNTLILDLKSTSGGSKTGTAPTRDESAAKAR